MSINPTAALLATQSYNREQLLCACNEIIPTLLMDDTDKSKMRLYCGRLANALDQCEGNTLQQRWAHFELTVWPKWRQGIDRPPSNCWTWGARVLIPARIVVPTMKWLSDIRVNQWAARFPDNYTLVSQHRLLLTATATVTWASAQTQQLAVCSGLRLLLVHGYDSLHEITDEDLRVLSRDYSKGMDTLDAALCLLGVFSRSPKHGSTRHSRHRQLTITELVDLSTPETFREVMTLYLNMYRTRVSDVYTTRRSKSVAMGHFWRFIAEHHPSVASSAQILPRHVRDYIPFALARSLEVQRTGNAGEEVRTTALVWLTELRTFFSDLCVWATEPDSPLEHFAPIAVPITRRTLFGVGFDKALKRSRARTTAKVLELEREMPNIRSFAFQRWREAVTAAPTATKSGDPRSKEANMFWDWALLELLVQSGLRIEEASDLTTFDILKRNMQDGSIYYMLHVKPSKFDRARVIPIGDGLGRVIAEMIRHVKLFNGTHHVPVCDHWNLHQKTPRLPAPYLIQSLRHPSPPGLTTIRNRIKDLSLGDGAKCADGTPLVLLPHDCRRVFASEHLNNNTPIHVIQALLGHASLDTVMIYAKLYPSQLVEEYRKTVRGLYNSHYGETAFKSPNAEEWTAFATSCSMRDMGTHLCALPTGEYCPKGLVCLGCTHAQPKKSAAPLFRKMLASHNRSLDAAKGNGEPAGQIAARQMELVRIKGALQRAEELTDDVAAAMEGLI